MIEKDKLLDSFVWVELKEEQDFLKVKETLTRIGVASRKEKKLYQSCHILHKQGKYAILHFKELFALDGKDTDFSEDDKGRRNTIATLLEQWNLLKILTPDKVKLPVTPLSQIKIIKWDEKPEWDLVAKYNIGHRK